MAEVEEIARIVTKNLKVCNELQIKSKKPYDIAYFNGKADVLKTIKDLLEEDN